MRHEKRFIAGFMGNVLHRENIYRPVLAKQFRPDSNFAPTVFPRSAACRLRHPRLKETGWDLVKKGGGQNARATVARASCPEPIGLT